MEMVSLPPLRMVRGQAFSQTWLFRDKATGQNIDLSGWTARLTFINCSKPALEMPIDILPSQRLSLSVSAEQVGTLISDTYQINLAAPIPDLNEVWQGNVYIAEAL